MKLIDANKLKRRAQRVATEAWKMKITASVETILNQFIDWIDEAQTVDTQDWIPVKERNPIEYDNPIEFIATLEDPSGERYVEFIEWDGYKWDDFYTDDNERGVWRYDKVIAWMKKPEPFKGDLNE